jgi:hypothetical protein
MTDEQQGPSGENQDRESADDARERSAAQDLADGLDLMLRAAKKAARRVDPQNIEELGRRALGNLEVLNKKRVDDLKNKAKRGLDPHRLEEIAEDAGKELLKVVERVAERVDSIVSKATHPFSDDKPASKAPKTGAAEAPTTEPSGSEAVDAKRVRVSDD